MVSVNYARLRGARGIRVGRGSDLDGPGLACFVSAPLGRAHDVTFQVGTGRTAHGSCPWSRQLSTLAKEAQCRVLVYAAFAIGHRPLGRLGAYGLILGRLPLRVFSIGKYAFQKKRA
jgi:hypothetical protein